MCPNLCRYFIFTVINFRGMLHHVCDLAYDKNMSGPIRTSKCRSTNWLINYVLSYFVSFWFCIGVFPRIIIKIFWAAIKNTKCKHSLVCIKNLHKNIIWKLSVYFRRWRIPVNFKLSSIICVEGVSQESFQINYNLISGRV